MATRPRNSSSSSGNKAPKKRTARGGGSRPQQSKTHKPEVYKFAALTGSGVNQGFELIAGTTSTVAASNAVPATAQSGVVCLNQIPIGSGTGQRRGRSVTLKSIMIRGMAKMKEITDPATQVNETYGRTKVRVVLVWALDASQGANNLLPGYEDVFTHKGVNAMTNDSNATKYKILRNWEYDLAQQGTPSISFSEMVQLKGRETVWQVSSDDGFYSTMQRGGLLIYVISDDPNDKATRVKLETRLYYTDV